MARTLKSAWASRVLACIAVDDDNTTIKDFVAANSITLGTGVAAGVGTATFKGATRGYFPTIANGAFGYFGITWNATYPVGTWTAGSVFVILNSYTSSTGFVTGDSSGSLANCVKTSSGKPALATIFTGNTALATSTKQSFMVIGRRAGTCEIHYGLESGSMTQDATATDSGPNLSTAYNLGSYGGISGQGNFVSNTHLFLVTNDAISNTDRDALHSDFVGTLFDTASSSSVAVKMGSYRRRRGMG